MRPKAFILSMKQCFLVLSINPANHAPGVKNGPTLMVRPKKKICLFPVTSPNFFGSVGRKTFFFLLIFFFFFFSILIGESPPSGCRIFPHLPLFTRTTWSFFTSHEYEKASLDTHADDMACITMTEF